MSDLPEDRDLLAAEYAVGLLEPYEARALEAAAARDPAAAAAIVRWEDRLAPLTGLADPVAPPAALWSRLELAAGLQLTAGPRFPTSVRRPSLPARAWRSPGLWRGVAGLAIAASIAIAVLLPDRTTTRYVAALAPVGGQPSAFIAQLRGDGAIILTPVSANAAPTGRDFQLWSLAPGGAPVSLGVLPAAGAVVTPTVQPASGTQLLVTIEQLGGSVNGQPNLPPVYGGAITRSY